MECHDYLARYLQKNTRGQDGNEASEPVALFELLGLEKTPDTTHKHVGNTKR